MNRRHRCIPLATLALRIMAVIALPAFSGFAQGPAGVAQLTAGPTYTGSDGKSNPKFPNIDLVFELKGPDGAPIAARPADLKLISDGQEIGTASSIRAFGQTEYGITSILALDASGSMKGAPLNAIHSSIAKFVSQARAQDRVAVLTFADNTQIDVPFGASQAALANELKSVQARGKLTRLYDGLLDSLALFTTAQPRRRQLLVISDGHDEGSAHTLAEVLLMAKPMGVVIDSIGLTGKDRGAYLASLKQLSLETGGTFVRAQSAQDLDGLIGRGIDATRATPVAAFRLTHLDADDKNHAVQLHWQAGNLSAPAFVRTPKSSLIRDLIPERISDLWAWALGACFVAGVILLVLSWRGARPKTDPNPKPMPGQNPAPVPPPASAFTSPPVSLVAPAARVRAAVRTPTLGEHVPQLKAYEAAASTKVEAAQTTPSAPRDMTVIERNRTQIAAFFHAPPSGPFARLEIAGGALAGQTVPVTAMNFTVGAAAVNNLVLPGDLTISSEHMQLLWQNSILKIEDRSSTNGTYVNAQRLAPGRHLLKPGDEIRIGQAVMVVRRT